MAGGMNQPIHLPRDADDRVVQCYGVNDAGVVSGTISGTPNRLAVPGLSTVVEIALDADCRVAFGDASVVATANSRILHRGLHLYSMTREQTHVSVLQLSGTDTGGWTMAEVI